MSSARLPILRLAVKSQRYSCHGCGNCCRDFTVQLRDDDLDRLRAQDWEHVLGEPVTVTFRGTTYLRQRDDGACVFLLDDGRCRIHAEHGLEAKPIACQLFPFSLTPAEGGAQAGVSFACQSVLESRGAELPTHDAELRRMLDRLPEVERAPAPPRLTQALRATGDEGRALTAAIDRWLRRDALDLPTRLDGLAWVAGSLAAAKLEAVREQRFGDLLDVLFGALPEELQFHPVTPPGAGQRRMLRQAVFTRTEDPKLGRIAHHGRLGTVLGQLSRSRRFRRGRGVAPCIGAGWPDDARLPDVERVGPAVTTDEVEAVDELLTRSLRARILGARAWGAGYYGWPMIDGLQALLVNVAVIGWLARLHAVGRGAGTLGLADVQVALGRVDRTAGRAPWLGSAAERLRLRFLRADEGLRRLAAGYALVAP